MLSFWQLLFRCDNDELTDQTGIETDLDGNHLSFLKSNSFRKHKIG